VEKLNISIESIIKEYDQKLSELNRQNVMLKVENIALKERIAKLDVEKPEPKAKE